MKTTKLNQSDFKKNIKTIVFIFVMLLSLASILPAASNSDVTTSPVELQWNYEKQVFDVLFSVHNRSEKTINLTSILVLKTKNKRRWRGAHLPAIPPRTSMDFQLELSSALMLKNNYTNIYLNLYRNQYKGFIDKSAYYQKLSSRKNLDGEKISVKLKELDFQENKEEVRQFIIGSAKDLKNLLPDGKAPGVYLKSGKTRPVEEVPFRKKRFTQKANTSKASTNIQSRTSFTSKPVNIQGIEGLIQQLDSPEFLSNQSAIQVKTQSYHPRDESSQIRKLADSLENKKSTYLKVPLEITKAFSVFEPATDLLVDISLEKNSFARGLKQALEMNPADIASQEKLVNFYLDQGQAEKAIMFLSDQLIQNPENLDTSLKISRVLQKSGNRNEALEILNTSLKRISLSARIALSQDLKSGVNAGKTTLSKDSDAAFLANEFINLGQSFLKSQQYDKALSAFQSLQSLSPEFPSLFYYLGLSRKGLQQYEEAKEAFLVQHKRKFNHLENLAAITDTFSFTMDIPAMGSIRKTYETLAETEKDKKNKTYLIQQAEKITALILETTLKIQSNSTDLALLIRTTGKFIPLQPYQNLDIHLTVMNLSGKNSPSFRVLYKLVSRNGTEIDFNQMDRQPGIKSGGQDRTWVTHLKTPGKLVYGDYRLVATLELQEGQWDKNIKNNKAETEYNFLFNGPDTKIANLSYHLKGKFSEGTDILLNIAWSNSGSLPVDNNQLVIKLKDIEDDEDSFILLETPIDAIPPLSDLITKQFKVTIPDISSWSSYQIEASLESLVGEKDINPANNVYLDQVKFEKNEDLVKSIPIQFYFHKDFSYPGEKTSWSFTVRHPKQLKAENFEAAVQFLNSKGKVLYPNPEKPDDIIYSRLKIGSETSENDLHNFTGTSIFPDIPPGNYNGRILFRQLDEDDTRISQISNRKINYRLAKLKLENIVVKSEELLPGHELEFQIVVRNEGGTPSKLEKVKVELAGIENYDLGSLEIEGLRPSESPYVLVKKVVAPANIRKGFYTLNMIKDSNEQGSSQRTRYPGLIEVRAIKILLPQSTESFPQNLIPDFQWEGDKSFKYRVNVSSDIKFQTKETLFSIPGEGWIQKRNIKPNAGEWQMIRMLAQLNNQPVFWRVEAITPAGKIAYSQPRELKLR